VGNGLNAVFDQAVHCVAAEPHAVVLRIYVTDRGQEVAYEAAVLGRLRKGYRVLQLRGQLGTRIELAFIFVKISSTKIENRWTTSRQLRISTRRHSTKVTVMRKTLVALQAKLSDAEMLKAEIAELRRANTAAARGPTDQAGVPEACTSDAISRAQQPRRTSFAPSLGSPTRTAAPNKDEIPTPGLNKCEDDESHGAAPPEDDVPTRAGPSVLVTPLRRSPLARFSPSPPGQRPSQREESSPLALPPRLHVAGVVSGAASWIAKQGKNGSTSSEAKGAKEVKEAEAAKEAKEAEEAKEAKEVGLWI